MRKLNIIYKNISSKDTIKNCKLFMKFIPDDVKDKLFESMIWYEDKEVVLWFSKTGDLFSCKITLNETGLIFSKMTGWWSQYMLLSNQCYDEHRLKIDFKDKTNEELKSIFIRIFESINDKKYL